MKQTGMTLIEMMIVVLLIGLLALAASPFSSAWVKSADVSKTLAALEQAVGSAKATALRNATAVQGDVAASALCLADNKLQLVTTVAGAAEINCNAVAADAVLWSTAIPQGVDIKWGELGVSDWTCSCFTNKGLLSATAANCNTCATNLTFTVSSGAESETLNIY